MGKFDGYMICTDLDGTFTKDTVPCAENEKYVKYFQENGGIFTVATGRPISHFSKFENFRPNCPVITHNGAVICNLETQEILYKAPLPKNISDIIEYILKNKNVKNVTLHELYSSKSISDICELSDNEEYIKVVVSCEPEDEAIKLRNDLLNKFGDKYCIFRAWSTGVECLAKNINKGTGVTELRKILGNKVKKLICVGDGENDAFMLKAADIGYAVENALPEAKNAADSVTVACKDGFVKTVLEEIEREF